MALQPKRVVVIGLESAAPHRLGQYIDGEHLPALKRLIDKGVTAENFRIYDRSPKLSIWTAIATGTCHGNEQAENIWDALNKDGKRCVVLNRSGLQADRVQNNEIIDHDLRSIGDQDDVRALDTRHALNPGVGEQIRIRHYQELGGVVLTYLQDMDWDFFFMPLFSPEPVTCASVNQKGPQERQENASLDRTREEAQLLLYHSQDRMVGKILEVCGKDTLVVMVLDHVSNPNLLSTGDEVEALGSLLILSGPGIKKGYRLQRAVRPADIIPTICYLMDWPVPDQVEGAVIYQAFRNPNSKAKEIKKMREALNRLEKALQIRDFQPWKKHYSA